MTYEEIKNQLNENPSINYEEKDGYLIIVFNKDIDIENLLNTSKIIYDYEKELFENKQRVNIIIRAKDFKTEKLEEWIKFALKDEDLCDPMMCLNIFNLIKNYNTLSDNFFESEDVYIGSIEQLLDIKLDLKEELSAVSTKLAIYFISLIKYVNKINFAFNDTAKKIENVYQIFLNLGDFFSLSNIVAQAKDFKMSDCVLIYDSMLYLMSILSKTSNGIDLMDMFLKGKDINDNSPSK